MLNVNANRRINLSAEVVFWLVVKTVESVHQALNAFRLLAVSVIVHAQKVIEHKQMARVQTSMNAMKANICVVLALHASTKQEVMNAYAHQATMVMHITVNAQLRNDDALVTRSVAQMRNVFNQANAFVRHHFSWTPVTEINAKVHANDFLAESTQNARHQIHHSACAKLDSKVIHCKAASTKMNAQLMEIPAHMVPNVSISKAATNACVRKA